MVTKTRDSYRVHQVEEGCYNVSHVTPETACLISVFGIVGGDDAEAKVEAEAYATRGNAGEFDDEERWHSENYPKMFAAFEGEILEDEPPISDKTVRFEQWDSVTQRAARQVDGEWEVHYYGVSWAYTRKQIAEQKAEEQRQAEIDQRGEVYRAFFGAHDETCGCSDCYNHDYSW